MVSFRLSSSGLVLLGLAGVSTTAFAGMPVFTTSRFTVPANAQRLQAADLDGDLDRDLVVLSIGRIQSAITVWINDGSGAFTSGWSSTLPGVVSASQSDLDVADVDLDGDVDLVLLVPGVLSQVRRNNGTGNFDTVVPLSVPGKHAQTAVGLIDGDLVPDLAIYSLNPTSVLSGWQGVGNGSFVAATSVAIANDDPSCRVQLGDLTGDGLLDFVRASNFGVEYFAGRSSAGFPTFGPSNVGWFDPCGDLELAHLDGDTHLDIVVTIPMSGAIEVFHGNPGGSLIGPAPYPGGSTPGPLAVGDLDQDNKPDVIVASRNNDVVSILPGSTGGIYLNVPVTISGLRGATDLITADLDGDGDLEVIATLRAGTVVVIENKLVP